MTEKPKKTPGRPKVGDMMRVRVPEQLLKDFAEIAEREFGQNTSETVRALMFEFVHKYKPRT